MRLNEFTEQNVEEGMMGNPGQEDSPVAQAIIRRILMQRTDLLAKYGPGYVGQAVDDVADSVGDWDEIGSSDVSGWVRQVEHNLKNKLNQYDEPMNVGDALDEQAVAEGSEQIYKILALDKGNALKKPTKLKWKASSLEDIFDALAAQDWYPLEINGVEVIAGKRLKQGVAEDEAPLKHHTARVSYHKEGDPHRRYEAIFKTTHNGGKEETEKRAKAAFAAKKKIVYDIVHEQGVAEGSLNEFAPDGFNGGDDGEEFNPRLAKMAYDEGVVKGVSLADGATLERAMAINDWDKHDGGIYKQHFAKGFKAGRMNKINHDNKQYNLNLKLMKDGSIRHGEQGMAEAGYGKATGRAAWDSNMPGYQGDYGGASNWGRRHREDDEHHEIDRRIEQEHEYRNTYGTWYVRIDGLVEPTPYKGKAAANAAALELKKQPGNENKVIMLTMKEQ